MQEADEPATLFPVHPAQHSAAQVMAVQAQAGAQLYRQDWEAATNYSRGLLTGQLYIKPGKDYFTCDISLQNSMTHIMSGHGAHSHRLKVQFSLERFFDRTTITT
jgi:hypothetical protein